MRKYKVGELKLDYNLYPRRELVSGNLSQMRNAHEAGAELPPPIIDKKSKRVTDGFHRVTTYLRCEGPGYEIECLEKSYKNEREMLLDAGRLNSINGVNLDNYDRAHFAILGHKLGIPDADLASALHMPIDRFQKLTIQKTAFARSKGKPLSVPKKGKHADESALSAKNQIPIKRTISHMAGKILENGQVEAIGKLGGMAQIWYVDQLILLIEQGFIDRDNEKMLDRMAYLKKLLVRFLKR